MGRTLVSLDADANPKPRDFSHLGVETQMHHPLPHEAYICSETTGSLWSKSGLSRLPSSDPNETGRKTTTAIKSPWRPQKRGDGRGTQEETLHHWFAITGLANISHSEREGRPPRPLSHCPGDRSSCALSPGHSLSLSLLVLPPRSLPLDIFQTQ